VNHATGTFDMRYMGGLRTVMPLTYAATTIAALSLAGIFPLAGFWSKDEVLAAAWSGGHAASFAIAQLAFWLGVAGVVLTAFYIARLVHLTFHGPFRGGVEAQPEAERSGDDHHVHLRESPLVMVGPMLLLAAASVASGFLANPSIATGVIPEHWLSHFLAAEVTQFRPGIAIASTLLALGGLGLATMVYQTKALSFDRLAHRLRWLHTLISQRYCVDHLYEGLVVRRLLYKGLFRLSDWMDIRVVDGAVDLAGWTGRNVGRAMAQLQTGQVQVYGAAVGIGIVVILLSYWTQR